MNHIFKSIEYFISDIIESLFWIILFWVMISLFGSGIKIKENNCGKSYPIDYVIYTNAFCEIKGE